MTSHHPFEEPPIVVEPFDVELDDNSMKERKYIARKSLPPDLIQADSSSFKDDESSSLSDKSIEFQSHNQQGGNQSNPIVEEASACSTIDEVKSASACSTINEANSASEENMVEENQAEEKRLEENHESFLTLRITYLIVTLVVMLADGLQGTHLYVLYEGYGFNVATLYCLGFVTGGLASPITGPLVDKLGRKKSALLYCALEIAINRLEQYPVLAGLIISRMVGGVTTNLLSTVFDTWLDTEYRRRGFKAEGYEIIMRDSVIVSNLAAIGSGYLAHILAETYGPKGPFEGAVACTSIALIVIMFLWTENYGCEQHQVKGMKHFMDDAVTALKSDNKVLRVGIIQGLTCASIQIFIFLWSPALRHFAESAPKGTIGLDSNGEPAYGLIFGAFMAAGVFGGLTAPYIRRFSTFILSGGDKDGERTNDDRNKPGAVEILSSICYLLCAFLLALPCLVHGEGVNSFSTCLAAFVVYEYIVALYLPCEGVLRSIYYPADGRASILTLPRIIVNVGVSLGVASTNYITIKAAFSVIFVLMVVSAALQLSLVADSELSSGFCELKNTLITIVSWVSTPCDDMKEAGVVSDMSYINPLKAFDSDLKLGSFSSSSETDDSDSESSCGSESKVHCKVTKLKLS